MVRHIWGLTVPPADDAEFKTAVITAANNIFDDGSKSFTVRTIIQYCGWKYDKSTTNRIGYYLRECGYTPIYRSGSSARWCAAQEVAGYSDSYREEVKAFLNKIDHNPILFDFEEKLFPEEDAA